MAEMSVFLGPAIAALNDNLRKLSPERHSAMYNLSVALLDIAKGLQVLRRDVDALKGGPATPSS
jgi:hypothetical protein